MSGICEEEKEKEKFYFAFKAGDWEVGPTNN